MKSKSPDVLLLFHNTFLEIYENDFMSLIGSCKDLFIYISNIQVQLDECNDYRKSNIVTDQYNFDIAMESIINKNMKDMTRSGAKFRTIQDKLDILKTKVHACLRLGMYSI
jgi:hypothetical protein